MKKKSMDLVRLSEETKKLTAMIVEDEKEANRLLKLDVSTAIEEWLEKQENKDQVLLLHGNGKSFSANDLIDEIRTQTPVGLEIEENMLKLTIDLLFRKQEKL